MKSAKFLFLIFLIIGGYIWLRSVEPYDFNRILSAPSIEHPLGTDDLGRDVLAKILSALFFSAKMTIITLSISFTISIFLGVIAGYLGGRIDFLVMRIVEITASFPTIPTIIFLLFILRDTFFGLSIAISFAILPELIYSIRVKAAEISSYDFVRIYEVMGVGSLKIMFKHILRNIFPKIRTLFLSYLVLCVILEANVSYLGFGSDESFGKLISDSRKYMVMRQGLWNLIFPLIFLMILIYALDRKAMRR